jgi:hypothetical protein
MMVGELMVDGIRHLSLIAEGRLTVCLAFLLSQVFQMET